MSLETEILFWIKPKFLMCSYSKVTKAVWYDFVVVGYRIFSFEFMIGYFIYQYQDCIESLTQSRCLLRDYNFAQNYNYKFFRFLSITYKQYYLSVY